MCLKIRMLINSRTTIFYHFIAVAVMFLSCNHSNNDIKQKSKVEVSPEKRTFKDTSVPACYSESDFQSIDIDSLKTILINLSNIHEVKNFSIENNHKILYCVTETDLNDIYQPNSYRIQVVFDAEDHYSTQFIFFVNKRSKKIKILEVVSDSLLSINEWREVNKTNYNMK